MTVSRCECPRCQTVFTKDVGDALFVSCPSCGALALPARDASEHALAIVLTDSKPSEVPVSALDDRTLTNDLPALASSLTSGHRSTTASQDGSGMFSGLIAGAPAPNPQEDAASPVTEPNAVSRGISEEFRFHFPSGSPEEPPRVEVVSRVSADSSSVASERSWSEMSEASASAALRRHSDVAAPGTQATPADAGRVPDAKETPLELTTGSFRDLERAFNDLAVRPSASPVRPSPLTTTEERFLFGDVRPVLPSPPSPPTLARTTPPPPPRRPKTTPVPPPRSSMRRDGDASASVPRPRLAGSGLSEESIRLAFLPAVAPTPVASGASAPVARAVSVALEEKTDPSAAGERQRGSLTRERVRARFLAPPVPSPWRGLTVARMASIAVICAAVGAAAGMLTVPRSNTDSVRARAHVRFADGNRFYQEGRFDDALGAFRGALTIDPSFGAAHRARGAALAKLARWDDAARAYEEYLKLEPNAPDAREVKDVLARRGGSVAEMADGTARP